jgi:hypothetical protein
MSAGASRHQSAFRIGGPNDLQRDFPATEKSFATQLVPA